MKPLPPAPFKLRHAFTITEILLIAVLLAILLSLLFPATAALRSRANRLGCVANLRTIGSALFAYASDHNGDLPFTTADQRYWYAPHTLAAKLVGPRGAAGYLECNLSQGTRWSDAMLCPGDPNADVWKKTLTYPRSYMYRQTDFSTAWESQPMKLLHKTRLDHNGRGQQTARRWLVTDRWTSTGEATHPYPGKQEIVEQGELIHPDNWTISSYWHKGGTNVLYEDGGVEWKPFGTVLGE